MKKHCELFCAGIWPFIVGPLLLLIPLLFFHWHPIERLVAANANEILAADHQWASAETFNRGRDVLLAGTAMSEEAVDQAILLTKQAPGVRSAEFVGELAAPLAKPVTISAQVENEQVVLRGTIDSQSSLDMLIASARRGFVNDRVRNEVTIDTDVAETLSLGDALIALSEVDNVAQLKLNGDRLVLMGEVTSLEEKSRIGNIASRRFEGDFSNQLAIVAPPCQATIRRLLATSKINFATDSADIQPSSETLLKQIAEAATECSDSTFEVTGHTDSTGSEKLNLSLAERRAVAVINHLVELGLAPTRLTARGVGSEDPLADNNTKIGRAANRRIEFRVTN